MPNVIDLFAGPGGLAEGFSSLFVNGVRRFNVRLSVEKEIIPHQTLRLRSFFRSFALGDAPDEYYDFLAGRATVEDVYGADPSRSAQASAEAMHATLGEYPHRLLDERIAEAINGDRNWVLTGGPPCQAYSTAGMAGNKVKKNYCPEEDPRFFLYREYLRVVAVHTPAVFVMENVKGLLTAKDKGRSIVREVMAGLSHPDEFMWREYRDLTNAPRYRLFSLNGNEISVDDDPNAFLAKGELYGLPQARHRVIIIGIREDMPAELLLVPGHETATTIGDVIGDLPALRSAASKNDSLQLWHDNLTSILDKTWLDESEQLHGPDLVRFIRESVKLAREGNLNFGGPWLEHASVTNWNSEWYTDPRMQGITHHESKAHCLSDMHRYFFCSCFGRVFGRSPHIMEFPESLLPKHKNAKSGHFKDRFRVQLPDKPSHTIISHLAKDGHAFIHPEPVQCRTLTPREAARLQTFPDNYYFFGGKVKQFEQVGNAVPPWLARLIAESVSSLIPA